MPTTGWFASQKTGSLKFRSSAGEYISQGHDQTFTAPPRAIFAKGGNRSLHVGMRGYYVDLQSRRGGFLKADHTYRKAMRFSDRRHPALDVSGHGRGCNESIGQFTVRRLKTEDGDVVSLKFDFTFHCESMHAPALRGSFVFHR